LDQSYTPWREVAAMKIKVPVFGSIGRSVTIEANPQGLNQAQVAMLIDNAIQAYARQAVSDAGSNASPVSALWSYITEKPPNIVDVWHLATSGFVMRLPDGTWTTDAGMTFGRASIIASVRL
jgi:hypothetical protein